MRKLRWWHVAVVGTVIVLSALDPPRAATVDADAFLKKPLDFDRLLELVRDHCR